MNLGKEWKISGYDAQFCIKESVSAYDKNERVVINKRIFLKKWALSVLAWMLIVYFYCFLTIFGLKQFFLQSPITEYFYSGFVHLEVLLTGLIFGTLFVWINYLTDYSEIRKKPFGFIILVKSTLYFLSLVICFVIVFVLFYYLEILSAEHFAFFRQKMVHFGFIASIVGYFSFFAVLMNFIIVINKKFGPGVLVDLLRGKYYHPREEQLILLFIDLKGSTTIAESMGHERYSQFLRECVHELTPVLIKNEANVYQYVGDEIVLHWKMKDGLDRLKCLDTFFEFRKRLDNRKKHFQNKYGVYPEFKAGMDTGEVTITEIGDVKREIAFHGDVLNTAARLEKQCNKYGKWLLVTENLINKVAAANGYQFEFLDDILLRGKQKRVKFFAVSHS
jgi:adenylate cyclase